MKRKRYDDEPAGQTHWHRNGECDFKILGQHCPLPIATITHHSFVETVKIAHGTHEAHQRHGLCRRHTSWEGDPQSEAELLARLSANRRERIAFMRRPDMYGPSWRLDLDDHERPHELAQRPGESRDEWFARMITFAGCGPWTRFLEKVMEAR